MAEVVIDTNVLIDFSRGFPRGAEFLVSLAERSLGISAMTWFEMIAGCRDKQELRKFERLVQRFEVLKFNEPTTDLATRLLTRYSLSHGLNVAAACSAASALVNNASLATGDASDFQFIRGLRLVAYP